jgi:hypothetical protein
VWDPDGSGEDNEHAKAPLEPLLVQLAAIEEKPASSTDTSIRRFGAPAVPATVSGEFVGSCEGMLKNGADGVGVPMTVLPTVRERASPVEAFRSVTVTEYVERAGALDEVWIVHRYDVPLVEHPIPLWPSTTAPLLVTRALTR